MNADRSRLEQSIAWERIYELCEELGMRETEETRLMSGFEYVSAFIKNLHTQRENLRTVCEAARAFLDCEEPTIEASDKLGEQLDAAIAKAMGAE